MTLLLSLGLILLLLAFYLLWQAHRQRQRLGLPGGRIIYTDVRARGLPVEKPLFDPHLGLTGKPDYLIEHKGHLIPVEVKTGRTPPAGPYDSHIYQLAAYCLLVERIYGKRPPYGIIHYPGRTFAIDYTSALESALLDLLAEMRRDDIRTDLPRSHTEPARCLKCGFRHICDQQLA